MTLSDRIKLWITRYKPILKAGNNGCLLWPLATSYGYGLLWARKDGKRYAFRAHRLALEVKLGRALGLLNACHTCDNPACCNPAHLFAGTDRDNYEDAVRKGRVVFGVKGKQRDHMGENHPGAVMTESLVKKIRRDAAKMGVKTSVVLSRKYGLHQTTIWNAVTRRTWAHVARESRVARDAK